MFTKTLTAVAIAAITALPIAGAAQAQNAGEAQLAASVGVEPGVYSLSQLNALASYQDDDSSAARSHINFILDNPAGQITQNVTR